MSGHAHAQTHEAAPRDQDVVMLDDAGHQSPQGFTAQGAIPGTQPQKKSHEGSASDAAFGSAGGSWAQGYIASVRAARARIKNQQQFLFEEDQWVGDRFQLVRDVMFNYQNRFNLAKGRFETNVQKYMEFGALRRETGSFFIGIALGKLVPEKLLTMIEKFSEMKETIEEPLELLDKWAGQVDSAKAGLKGRPAGPAPATAEAKAPEGGEVDWLGLTDKILASHNNFRSSLGSITRLEDAYDGILDQLTDVALGMANDGPDSVLAMRAQLASELSIQYESFLIRESASFAREVQANLDTQLVVDIERQMAMDWIAALPQDQLTALRDVYPYFEQIGAMGADSAGKGLGIHSWCKMDHERVQVWARAKVREEAMGAVGKKVQWLGGVQLGDHLLGTVKVGDSVLAARAPVAPDDKCYDANVFVDHNPATVRVTRVRFTEEIPEVTSSWSGPNVRDYMQQMRMGMVELQVEASGEGPNSQLGPTMEAGTDMGPTSFLMGD